MSDIQEQPTWWQAPDGRWYPPELAPTEDVDADPKNIGKFNRVIKPRKPVQKLRARLKEHRQHRATNKQLQRQAPKQPLPALRSIPRETRIKVAAAGVGILTLLGTAAAVDYLSSEEQPQLNPSPVVQPVEGLQPADASANNVGEEREAAAQLGAPFTSAAFGTTQRIADDWYVTVTAVEDATPYLDEFQDSEWDPDTYGGVVVVRMEITYVGPQALAPRDFWVTMADPFTGLNPDAYPPCRLNADQPQATNFSTGQTTQHTACRSAGHPNAASWGVRLEAGALHDGGTTAHFSSEGNLQEEAIPEPAAPQPPKPEVAPPASMGTATDVGPLRFDVVGAVATPQIDRPGWFILEVNHQVSPIGTADLPGEYFDNIPFFTTYAAGSLALPPMSDGCPSPAADTGTDESGNRTTVTCYLVRASELADMRFIIDPGRLSELQDAPTVVFLLDKVLVLEDNG